MSVGNPTATNTCHSTPSNHIRSPEHRRPNVQLPPSCYTYGSPPVLAHVNGGGGDKVLQLLGLDRSNCRCARLCFGC